MDGKFAQEHQVRIDPQGATHSTIELADGTTATCEGKAKNIHLKIQTYQAKGQHFDVLALGKYDAILGKS